MEMRFKKSLGYFFLFVGFFFFLRVIPVFHCWIEESFRVSDTEEFGFNYWVGVITTVFCSSFLPMTIGVRLIKSD